MSDKPGGCLPCKLILPVAAAVGATLGVGVVVARSIFYPYRVRTKATTTMQRLSGGATDGWLCRAFPRLPGCGYKS